MGQAYVVVHAPRRPLRALFPNTALAHWYVTVDAELRWDDGTIEAVARGTPLLPQSGTTLDMTTTYWLVVWKQGVTPQAPIAIAQNDFVNIDALVGGTWAISHWITDDAEVFQQV